MSLSERVKAVYLDRLNELIQSGESIPMKPHSRVTSSNSITGEKTYRHFNLASWSEFVEWRTSCIAVLDQVVSPDGVDCMKVSTHADIRNVKGVFYLDKELGLKINKATAIIDQNGLLPVDTELQPHTSYAHYKFELECSGEMGEKETKAPIEMKMEMEVWVDQKLTMVAPKNQKMAVLRKD